MNTLNSLKCAVVLLPALAMGIPMAYASDDCPCPCPEERTTAMTGTDRAQQRSDRAERAEQRAEQRADHHTDQRQRAEQRAEQRDDQRAAYGRTAQYLETKPRRGFQSDSLVGQEVKSRTNNETIGTVSNLLLDEDGQVVAVVIGVGGLLGIGERDVAIAWDQVERTYDDDDDVVLWVDLNEENLKDAPKYESERTRSRSRR